MSTLPPEQFFGRSEPCKDCPFLRNSSTDQSLSAERKADIASSLIRGDSFVCHKTVRYDKEEASQQDRSLMCAGARRTLYRHGTTHHTITAITSEQVATRLGFDVPPCSSARDDDMYPDFYAWMHTDTLANPSHPKDPS